VVGTWSYADRNMPPAFASMQWRGGKWHGRMASCILPFRATFFVFSDYMKPAIRLGRSRNISAEELKSAARYLSSQTAISIIRQ
jgi:hypothetical protein